MCGILLNVSYGESVSVDHPALSIISHRGPNAAGAETFSNQDVKISLGHRRLSIIDLSQCANQPMQYEKSNYWVVFNGEIYNYREIRRELQKENYIFKTSSDTEVILASYLKWGIHCLHKFNGMFAFVIYDKPKERIFIARDRFGIKPLYYFNSSHCFRAASEIKQFLSVKNFSPKINKTKLYHFLNSGDFSFDSETMWQHIYELEPGHYIELHIDTWKPGSEIKQQKWYSPPFFSEKLKISFEDACCEFRNLLEDAVRLRLRSDVPVGFLLSGGLDSSTLVGIGHLLSGERTEHLKTYSSCYKNSKIDESEYVQEMIRFSDAEHMLHYPDPKDIEKNLEKVIWHNDLPVLHGSPTVHWLLYKKIKEENDSRIVIIEGQGGDEILCGYGDFYWAYLNEVLFQNPFKFFKEWESFKTQHPAETAKIATIKFFRMNFPQLVSFPPSKLLRVEELLGKEDAPPIAVKREESSVAKLHHNRFKILRYILHNVDRNSMAHSREARTPFLDFRLVEFCLKLPSEYKIRNGLSKFILRKSAEKYIPAKIANRTDKQGYSSPTADWLKTNLKPFILKKIDEFSYLPFINAEALKSEFEKYANNLTSFNPVIWRIISTGLWIEQFKLNF